MRAAIGQRFWICGCHPGNRLEKLAGGGDGRFLRCGRRQGTGPLPPPTCSYLLSSARPSPDGRVCASAAVVRRPRCGPVLGVCRGEHLVLLGGGRIPEVGGVASR